MPIGHRTGIGLIPPEDPIGIMNGQIKSSISLEAHVDEIAEERALRRIVDNCSQGFDNLAGRIFYNSGLIM